MSRVSSSEQDVDIDLSQLFRAIWQRRGRVLAATAVAAGLAFAVASLISPTYRTETRILIEQRAPAFAKTDATSAEPQSVLDELNIASQVQVLQSVDLIKQVARDMKLYELEEFDPTANPSAISDLLVVLGIKKNPLDMAPEERVLKEFTEKLQVYQVEKSRVIGIQFSSKDPKLAAAIPNAMAKVYLSLQSGAKLDSNSEATRWLEPEIANLREKVSAAEKKVADYRSSSDLLQTGTSNTFAIQQLNDISQELARVRGEKANSQARADSVRAALSAGRSTDTLTDVVGSQMIQRLKETQSGIQAQISDLSTSLLEGHPRLKGLRAQLTDIQGQISRETQKILASLENEANVSNLRERQLVQQLNTLKAESARSGEEEVGLKALEREAAAQRELLETYLSRFREASSRADKNSSPADARIISQAVEPQEPQFPKVLPIVIVAALAAFVLSSVVIMLMELFSGRALKPVNFVDQRVELRDAPVMSTSEPVVVVTAAAVRPTSLLSVEPEEVAAAAPAPLTIEPEAEDEAVAEAEAEDDYSITAVARYLCEQQTRIAISVSPSGDDGSTATVMLAREVAEGGRTVILLDMTGSACPSRLMAAALDLPGITDLLTGNAAFTDTIHPDRLSRADIVPRGTSDIRQAMRGADRLSMIVDALADAYDLVLVECGAADVNGVSKLTRNPSAEVILSVPNPNEDDLAAVIGEFEAAGYADLVFMSGAAPDAGHGAGRRAA